MTIRVVSSAPVKANRIVCPHCGYELEYTENDLDRMGGAMLSTGREILRTLRCPREECDKRIHVDTLTE